MALSDEQNAMLRLLASGEQGYADIAALLGLSEDEVRAKVVGALAQLQAEGKPTPDVPPPLPGGARPAAEVTPPEPEPVEPAPAADVEPAIADAVAPPPADDKPTAAMPADAKPSAATSGSADAEAKPAPAQPSPPAAAVASASPPSSGPPSGGRTITLPSGRGAWLLGGGVVAAIVVIVVVILVASGGGGGSSSTTAAEVPANAAAEEGAGAAEEGAKEGTAAEKEAAAGNEPTEAELVAVDGGEAAGRGAFGRVKNKLALQVEATGLEPTTKGTDSYWIWLAQSPKRMLPLASVEVKASGKGAGTIAAEFEVPVEVLGYLASGTFDQMTITLADNARIQSSVEAAKKEKTTPAYTGKAVLHGTITGPIVGLAAREKEEKETE